MKDFLVIPDEAVISKIYLFRDKKVMLDSDLADLYGVETRVLNQAIKRNEDRFPEDFMFQLTEKEFEKLKSQVGKGNWGGRRIAPNVFTEHGVLMLSSVLNSKKAIAVNIQIVRIFTKMREMLLTHKDLLLEMEELRTKVRGQDDKIGMLYNYLNQFITEEKPEPLEPIGFKLTNK